MIHDTFQNIRRYAALPDGLGAALEKARSFDLSLPDGRHPIDGERLYAMLMHYETRPVEGGLFEAHRRYIDIQVVLEGRERCDVDLAAEALQVSRPYDEAGDAALYLAPASFATLILSPGSFAVFYPNDAHRPNCRIDAPAPVRKLVLKVLVGR